MSLTVLDPGLQTLIQSSPRNELRHKGVPTGGATDPLSLALANRLLDQPADTPALEITLSGAAFRFNAPTRFAVTGGACQITYDDTPRPMHETISAKAGGVVKIKPENRGARHYLALAGGLAASTWLGSKSTCLVTGLGGHEGRQLKTEDTIPFAATSQPEACATHPYQTPATLRPHMGQSWILRAISGPEFQHVGTADQARFYAETFQVSPRVNRMGAELSGLRIDLADQGRMPSAAVFPGTVQCPPSGVPYLLMCDAGTTGGYLRLAHVIRADRHMLGQVRPGDKIQFKLTTPDEAMRALREKTELFQSWLGDAFELG